MNEERINKSSNSKEIDPSDFLKILLDSKYLILLVTLFFSIASVIYAINQPNYYTSAALLEVSSNDSQRASSSLSRYSGIAAMAGINLPSESKDKGNTSIAIIQSRDFFNHLITANPQFLPQIVSAKSYDRLTGKTLYDQDQYDSILSKWIRSSNEYENYPSPSYLEAHAIFIKDILRILKDKETGYIHISIEHLSPLFANTLLNEIVLQLNKISRDKDMIESQKALDFLKAQAAKTRLSEISSSISNLIETQLQTQMMAQIKEDYILRYIDKPFVPEKKSKPSRALICILGFLTGFFVSIFMAFLLYSLKKIKHKN